MGKRESCLRELQRVESDRSKGFDLVSVALDYKGVVGENKIEVLPNALAIVRIEC